MSPERDDSLPIAAKASIAEGALEHIRTLHEQVREYSGRKGDATPLHMRIRRGLGSIRRTGRRVHKYPRAFARGFRAAKRSTNFRDTEVDDLLSKDRGEEAAALAAALLPVRRDDPKFLAAASKAFARVGAISLQAQTIAAQRKINDSPVLERRERIIRARLRETDHSWLPLAVDVPHTLVPNADRILHLLKASMPHRQSGYTMRSQYVIDSQREAGLDPVAMTALGFPRNIGITDFVEKELINGTVHYRLDIDDASLLADETDRYLEEYAKQAYARVAEIEPSIIHVHSGHRGYEAALVGIALAQRFNIPAVYEVRGFFESLWSRDSRLNERGELYERRYATETRCMSAADAVVTLSESMREEIIARGVSGSKVFVVPNGVDIEAFSPGARSEALVHRLGLTGKFVFGYVSNLDHYREGHELLIRAAVSLRERGVPAVALIIGDGVRRAELEAFAAAEGAGESVIFTGRIAHHEVADYYRLLDVFVIPRLAERAARLVTPLKPFEAMASGVPVVVSNLDALLEITGNGARGRSFAVGDADSLAGTLAQLHESPADRRRLAKLGREWVITERQWAANARRYAEIYAKLS